VKLIKNYLRCIPSELSDVTILSIDLAEYIDFDEVIHKSAALKARKEKYPLDL